MNENNYPGGSPMLASGFDHRMLLKGAGAAGLFGAFASISGGSSFAAATTLPPAVTTIKRVNSGSFTYELITTAPQLLQKLYVSNFDFKSFSGPAQTLADRAKAGGHLALINSDSWANVDGSGSYTNSV